MLMNVCMFGHNVCSPNSSRYSGNCLCWSLFVVAVSRVFPFAGILQSDTSGFGMERTSSAPPVQAGPMAHAHTVRPFKLSVRWAFRCVLVSCLTRFGWPVVFSRRLRLNLRVLRRCQPPHQRRPFRFLFPRLRRRMSTCPLPFRLPPFRLLPSIITYRLTHLSPRTSRIISPGLAMGDTTVVAVITAARHSTRKALGQGTLRRIILEVHHPTVGTILRECLRLANQRLWL
jgi:hypothetical protein